MAPHRLKSRLDLRIEAAGVTPPTFRFWLIARTPTTLIDYLLEVLSAAIGLMLGPAFLTGFISSNTARGLDEPVTMLLSWTLIAGSLVVIIGLSLRKYGSTVPAGMFMLSAAFLAYGIAVLSYNELNVGLVTVLMSGGLAGLVGWKAFLLRSTFILITSRGLHVDREG